jgi:hypothetical protein
MIGKGLLTADAVGRRVAIWDERNQRRMFGELKAWSTDHNEVMIRLERNYGKGMKAGTLMRAPRDIASFVEPSHAGAEAAAAAAGE